MKVPIGRFPPVRNRANTCCMLTRDRFVVPVLGLGQVIAFASSYYLLGVLADPMAASMAINPASIFMSLSVAFLISAILTPLAGRWTEHHGGRLVLAGSNLAFAASLILMAFARSAPELWLAVASLGVGMGVGLYGTAFAVVVALHGARARPDITAVSLIGALGGALGWPVSRWVVETWDWRTACLLWALSHLVLCLPLALAVLPRHAPTALASSELPAPVVWDRPMLQLAALFAGAWAVATAMGAHLPRLLADLGLSESDAAWAAGLMAASAIVARLFDLIVLRKSHPILVARIGTLCHPLGAAFAVVFAPLVAIGQGLGNGLLSVASGVLPLHVFGPDRYAVRQAMLLTPARYLQAAAPAAFALVLDRSPWLALMVSSGLCLAMMAATLGLGPPRPAPWAQPSNHSSRSR